VQVSLTKRLSIMFMLAVVGVLAVAGLSFRQLTLHHFEEIDRQTLEEKMTAAEQILRTAGQGGSFNAAFPELKALLGGHQDLYVVIEDLSGQILFSEAGLNGLHDHLKPFRHQSAEELKAGGKVWRASKKRIDINGQEPVTILLMLDITAHKAFFSTLANWLWTGLFIFAFVGALLGWLLARAGLRPLKEVTNVFSSISERSLEDRISTQNIPVELRDMTAAFNGMLARLESAFVKLSHFSADIAHELRTPLTNLITHTEVVLTRARTADDYKENLYANLEDLQRMSRMIDDMLFLAKASNGLVIPQQRLFALEQLCASVLEYYQFEAEERDIRFVVTGKVNAYIDEQMIRRAISNVISNALRYTSDNQQIVVSLSKAGQFARIEIANPGEAIAPEHLERLFDRFYQADPSRTKGSSGSAGSAGLGLAITLSIANAHGGTAWCSSVQGVTRFFLELSLDNVEPKEN
jgi:two-component system heavy metal sensor histidine kinase CusS